MSEILFLGEQDCTEINAVLEHIDENDAVIVGDDELQNNIEIICNDYPHDLTVKLDGYELNPRSIFWKNIYFESFELGHDDYRNNLSYARLFLDAFPDAYWVNPEHAFHDHFTKVRQTIIAREVGALMPETLMTSDNEAALAFIERVKDVAAKPVAGGQYTKRLTPDTASMIVPQLSGVGMQPYCYQQFIDGTNLRTFVIGDKTFSAKIYTSKCDFRVDDNIETIPVEMSDEHNQLALDIARSLGLEWTAIDWVIDKDENVYYLEANFAPMFTYFQYVTEYPIAKELALLLYS